VRVGLDYLASLRVEFRAIFLMRHCRIDILYMVLGLVEDEVLDEHHLKTVLEKYLSVARLILST